MRANQGARSAALNPRISNSRAQCSSVAAGVRKLEVQLTVVPPPTQRPCRILIALSLVLRADDSWYSWEYASASRIWKSDDVASGPSSTRTTLRPASLRISAAVPPPAPVPTMTTSASRVRSCDNVDASRTFHPFAIPIRTGSSDAAARDDAAAISRAPAMAARDIRSPARSAYCHTTPPGRADAARRIPNGAA